MIAYYILTCEYVVAKCFQCTLKVDFFNQGFREQCLLHTVFVLVASNFGPIAEGDSKQNSFGTAEDSCPTEDRCSNPHSPSSKFWAIIIFVGHSMY